MLRSIGDAVIYLTYLVCFSQFVLNLLATINIVPTMSIHWLLAPFASLGIIVNSALAIPLYLII